MKLETKRANLTIPSYSIKEDALPFLNCRLQYRYHRGGSLPYASMERFWFGLFVHGVLELAYRFWKSEIDSGRTPPQFPEFPLRCDDSELRGDAPILPEYRDISEFADRVEKSLCRQGVRAPSCAVRNSAYARVGIMVNALGAHLFPLIDKVEHKISATRPMPQSGSDSGRDSYELRGVLDALASARNIDGNLITGCPDIKMNSELILEYKGARRPARGASLWNQDELQVLAYAWLRERESGKLPSAGIVIYVNELRSAPVNRRELDKLLDKAIRVIPISRQTVDNAIAKIDDVARQIEDALADEETGGSATRSWQPNCQDKSVCDDCDFLHFCPKPAWAQTNYAIKAPTAP